MRSRGLLESIAAGLVVIMAGIAAAELRCAFACQASGTKAAATRVHCHEATVDDATRLEGDQPCRDLAPRVAAIEPSGAYRALFVSVITAAAAVPPSSTVATVLAVVGWDASPPPARSAPFILRI